MTACNDCGQTHRTGLDGIRCDLAHLGEPRTRRGLTAFGLTPRQIDQLIKQADNEQEPQP